MAEARKHEEMPDSESKVSAPYLSRWMFPEHARRSEIALAIVVIAIYGVVIFATSPPYSERPYAEFIHLLLLLGFGVVSFGLWDLWALRALRKKLKRDRGALLQWARQGGQDREMASQDLGGGLLQAALRRYLALGRPSADFLNDSLHDNLSHVRIGSAYLQYAVASAPLLGLLGTILGLMATFRDPRLIESGSMQLELAMPYLGIALVTTMLGLMITLLSLLFIGLINRAVASDCQRLVEPVVETLTLEYADSKKSLSEGEDSEPLFAGRTCSSELARSRALSAAQALLMTVVLILAVSLPGGVADRIFSSTQETAVSEISPTPPVRQPPAPRQEAPPPPQEKPPETVVDRFEIELEELLELYEQAVEPADAEKLVFAFLRYRDQRPPEENDLGQSLLARTFEEERVPIGGFVNLVSPPVERSRLDLLYPRLIARFDCLVQGNRLTLQPIVTFGTLDGSGAPLVQTARYIEFRETLEESGFSYKWGQILDRERIKALLVDGAIRRFRDRADNAWKNLGRSSTAGEEHIVMWLLYEPESKFMLAKESFARQILNGGTGDFVVLNWETGPANGGDIVLGGVEIATPKMALRRLRENLKLDG